MKQSRILILLLFLLGLAGTLTTNAPVYIRLLYLSLFAVAGSWLWVRISLSGMQISRRSRTLRANVGDIYDENFEIANTNRLPCPWLAVENKTELPAASGSRLLVNIKHGQTQSYLARTWLTQRGAFPLGPTSLTAHDPLGLFQKSKDFPAASELIVLPLIVPLQSFPAPPGLLPGGKVLRQKSLGITPHAAGVREYAPGDALRRIHWATSARRQQLMVKEFEEDPQAEVWIFLDAYADVQAALPDAGLARYWDGWMLGKRPEFELPPATLEYSVTIAASLAHYFTRERRSVGLIAAGQTHIAIPADRSIRQEEKILETLAFVKAGKDLPIESLVRAQAGQILSGGSAVILTPTVRPELVAAVDELQRRNLHPTVVLLDAATFGGAEGSKGLEVSLKNLSVPVFRIKYGDDIGTALSSFQTTNHPRESLLWHMPSIPST